MQLEQDMVVAERFRLVKKIGQGGMGSVWQAMDQRLSTPCAVKFIEGELANMAEAHQRFQREAQAAAQLRSPHVVQISDHGVWQGSPYIAMELLDGEDLGKRIGKLGGRVPSAIVNAVVQQVCRALSKAHQAGVVHRDLKPDNIFLVTDDDREIVKILDFGVAKSASQAIDGSNTKTGAMLGTPYYMSPEQAQGIKSVDSRSDLWSLAVIVFQCLTGRLPFESEALGDLLVKIIVSPIPTPSAYNPGLPLSFDSWWAKAADRNPDNRFQSAKAFAESLELALGQSSVTEITERNRVMRGGGGTAMMINAPASEVLLHSPNAPHPGAHPPAMNTPHALNTPPQMQGGAAPRMQAPNPPNPTGGYDGGQYGAPRGIAQGASTGPGTGATFSGVEPPAGVPGKGPPVALFVGIGALALVGLALGGVALVRGRGHAADAPVVSGAGSGSAGESPSARPAQTSTATAEPAASAAVVASAVASATASATAATEPEPAGSASASPSAAAAGGNPAGGAHHASPGAPKAPASAKPPPVAVVAPPPTPATAATAATPPPKGREKPINLGF
jgi:serine/threonine-protein kinase